MENNNKELTISVNNALNAYRNTDENGRELLEHLFGKEVFELKDVKERIKTFEDAMNELGAEDPLVTLYESFLKDIPEKDNMDVDVTAYLKLRIIAAALNEGWKPKFDREEIRWYPHFYILTKEEYDRLDEDEKKECRVVGRAVSDACVGVGFFFSAASFAWSSSGKDYGYLLSFRTDELAEYCGKQFIDLWIEYLIG